METVLSRVDKGATDVATDEVSVCVSMQKSLAVNNFTHKTIPYFQKFHQYFRQCLLFVAVRKERKKNSNKVDYQRFEYKK